MRYLLAATTLVVLILTVSCNSSDDNAASPSASPTTTPSPGSSVVAASPAARLTPTPSPEAPLYIALGDSLSAGVGASDRASTAFVPLVQKGLGGNVGLMNLGHSGDTSQQLLEHGYVDQAVAEIKKRNGDSNPNNDVVLVTLEIGGNDLLGLYFNLVIPGKCPTVEESLQRPDCVNGLRDTLDKYAPNLKKAVDSLQAADPHLRIVLITLYNPFSGGARTLDTLGELSLEGTPNTPFPEGLNDLIRAQAQASGVILADVYPLFLGKSHEYIASDLIHPNDSGHRVMADAVLAAIAN